MNESRQKVNTPETDQEMINPDVTSPIQGSFQEDCGKDQEQEEPQPDLFRLKLVIGCIVILNLIFGFYALKSDRFVTQPQESDSVQKEKVLPSPSSNQNENEIQDPVSESN